MSGLVRLVPILLQKSKIERERKFRESLFFEVSIAGKARSADPKVRGRFLCRNDVARSRRRVRNASAVLKTFERQSKRSFATPSTERRISPFQGVWSASDPSGSSHFRSASGKSDTISVAHLAHAMKHRDLYSREIKSAAICNSVIRRQQFKRLPPLAVPARGDAVGTRILSFVQG